MTTKAILPFCEQRYISHQLFWLFFEMKRLVSKVALLRDPAGRWLVYNVVAKWYQLLLQELENGGVRVVNYQRSNQLHQAAPAECGHKLPTRSILVLALLVQVLAFHREQYCQMCNRAHRINPWILAQLLYGKMGISLSNYWWRWLLNNQRITEKA